MGSLFKPDVQQANNEIKFPPWVEDAMKGAIGQGQDLANRPYTPFEGQRFADFNPLQNNAFASANLFGQMGLGALGQGYNALNDPTGRGMMSNAYYGLGNFANQDYGNLGQAEASLQGPAAQGQLINRGDVRNVNPGSVLDRNVGDYMNPYTDNVINNVASDVNRAQQISLNQGEAAANAAGAFGGSRHGISDAVTRSEYDRNFGQLSDQMRQSAYNNAMGLMQGDINRDFAGQQFNAGMDFNVGQLGQMGSLQNAGMVNQRNALNAQLGTQTNLANAANQIANRGMDLQALLGQGNLGSQYANNLLNAGNSLMGFGQAGLGAQMGAGNQIQGYENQQLGFDYDQFREARDWTANNFQYMMAPLGMNLPHTQSQDMFGPSPFSQAAGLGMSLFGMFSDIRLKKNIKRIGTLNGHNVYQWDWRDGSGAGAGFIAQEHPEHTFEVDGYLMLNMSELL